MNALKQKRGIAKATLTRAAEFIMLIDESTTIDMLEIRLKRVVEAWSEFTSLHYECLQHMEENEDLDAFNVDFSSYEEKYFLAHAGLNRAIRERTSKCDDNNNNSSMFERLANDHSELFKTLGSTSKDPTKVRLPPIVIPKFSGEYKDWPSFRDLFLATVDIKENLSSTHKFQYLKSFLSGTAADVIQHIKVSEANYTEAWDRLEKRFDRGHLIVQSFIQTFMSLPSINSPNVQLLRKLTDGADEVIRGLSALSKNNRDPWLIYILLGKLDNDTKQAWAEEVGCREDQSITEFIEFLELRCYALESCQTLNRTPISTRGKSTSAVRALVARPSDKRSQCPLCKTNHNLYQCSQFLDLDIPSRREFTKTNSICFSCLRPGHSISKCHSNFRCRICKARHHYLVHQDDTVGTPAPISTSNQSSSSSSVPSSSSSSSSSSSLLATSQGRTPETLNRSLIGQLVNNHCRESIASKQIVLPTILAKIKNCQNQFIDVRILLDTGSQSSFVSESCVQNLGLRRKHARVPVLGLGSIEAGQTKGRVSLNLMSRYDSTLLSIDAFCLTRLTSNLPSNSFQISNWDYLCHLNLADPYFNMSGPIDIILGADKAWSILKPEQVIGPEGRPIAQNTTFGWVISGELNESNDVGSALSSFHSTCDVDYLLQKFWELEEVSSHDSPASLNDPAEKHFQGTFGRALDGKYVVSLPFKNQVPKFEGTLQSAVSRLYAMERRFTNNPELHRQYVLFMKEYLDLGHMELIPSSEIDKNRSCQFYLPHHSVLKPDSSTTKLRVVFDGSAKDINGNSLNSQLLIGPSIQRDLFGVCLRFRQHRFVFTADIVKMFRQIWVHKNDRDYQRIVWREDKKKPIEHYRLKTVTYGTASAPFLSVRGSSTTRYRL